MVHEKALRQSYSLDRFDERAVKNEIFSPAVFNILKEPFIVQKETLHQQKALDLSYLDLEGQGRGIVRRAPHQHFVKSKFRFFQ